MGGNAWVGGLICYIKCKDGHNAPNMQKNVLKLGIERSGFAPFSFVNSGPTNKRDSTARKQLAICLSNTL